MPRIGASVTRAPLGALSCPYSGSSGAAGPRHWCASLTTDYWNPPTSERQHLRQRIPAAIVAFVLAAILVQAGW